MLGFRGVRTSCHRDFLHSFLALCAGTIQLLTFFARSTALSITAMQLRTPSCPKPVTAMAFSVYICLALMPLAVTVFAARAGGRIASESMRTLMILAGAIFAGHIAHALPLFAPSLATASDACSSITLMNTPAECPVRGPEFCAYTTDEGAVVWRFGLVDSPLLPSAFSAIAVAVISVLAVPPFPHGAVLCLLFLGASIAARISYPSRTLLEFSMMLALYALHPAYAYFIEPILSRHYASKTEAETPEAARLAAVHIASSPKGADAAERDDRRADNPEQEDSGSYEYTYSDEGEDERSHDAGVAEQQRRPASLQQSLPRGFGDPAAVTPGQAGATGTPQYGEMPAPASDFVGAVV
jgi:hypothetical protein